MKKILLYLIFFPVFVSSSIRAQNGTVKNYYPDHKLKSELSYVNDVLDGTAVYYYSNGNIQLEKNFSRGILHGWVKEFYENGKPKSEYYIKNGIKDGDQKEYYDDGNLKEIISYNEGVFVNKQSFEYAGKKLEAGKQVSAIDSSKLSEKDEIFIQPSIFGGIKSIREKILYPDDARKFGLEGIVSVKITIDDAGNVVKTEILKPIGLGCEEAAIKAIMESKFAAASKNGKPVESQLVIDLPFLLPEIKNPVVKEEPRKENQERKFDQNLSLMCEAEKCPRPLDDMQTIYSRIEIPNVAKALKLKGIILIEGFVDKEGNLKQTKIIDGVGYGVDQVVEAALIRSKFIPGVQKGITTEIKVIIKFPVSFDL